MYANVGNSHCTRRSYRMLYFGVMSEESTFSLQTYALGVVLTLVYVY